MELPRPNPLIQKAIISADSKLSGSDQAVKLYWKMQKTTAKPGVHIAIAVLKACSYFAALNTGRLIHIVIVESGCESDLVLGNSLINMYGKCGSFQDACRVFYNLPKMDVVTWSAMIAGFACYGRGQEAIQLSLQMKQEGMLPNAVTIACILKSCFHVASLEQGKITHVYVIENDFESDPFVGSALIDMYIKCGDLEESDRVFHKLMGDSVLTWSIIIAGYVEHGHSWKAIQYFHQMQTVGTNPNKVVFVNVLKACSSISGLHQGKMFHTQIIEVGYASDSFVGSALINMYVKGGDLEMAGSVLENSTKGSVVPWNTLIAGYCHCGHGEKALQLFYQLQQECVKPDNVTFVCILKACSSIAALNEGKIIHTNIIQSSRGFYECIECSLIDMYAKCGSLEDARRLFDKSPIKDVFAWSIMITGYAEHGHGGEAFQLFQELQGEGIEPNNVTFTGMLKACSLAAALNEGRAIHAEILKHDLESDVHISSTLIDMYVKCGRFDDAYWLFTRVSTRNVVMYSVIIGGCAKYGLSQEVAEVSEQMQMEGIKPDKITFLAILKASSNTVDLKQGKMAHAQAIENNCGVDMFLASSLIDMYAKCHSLGDAHKVFETLPRKNLVTWNAMITGYSHHGMGQEALQLCQQMQKEGMKPNDVTFVSTLKACSNIAALEQGKLLHYSIVDRGCEVNIFIGGALVDMYAKCRCFEDACKVLYSMPNQSSAMWNSLIVGYAQDSDYKLALQYFMDMQQEGSEPNEVTFSCLLTACGHVGFVDIGCRYLKHMNEMHGISATLDLFNCMIDLHGRAGSLKEAEDILRSFPCQSNVVGWTSLLSHCRTYSNLEIGKSCFDHLVSSDFSHASPYVIMSNIYSNAGMWEEANRIHDLRKSSLVWKKPGKVCVEVHNKMHEFFIGDKSHSQSNIIHAKIKVLGFHMEEHGYVPHLD